MNWWQKMGAWLFGIEQKKIPIHTTVYGTHNQEVWSDWQEMRATEEGYKKSAWVYSAIRELSTPFASVPIKLQKRKGQQWDDVLDHPLQKLLDQPNEFMSRQDLATRWMQHMSLSGNAIFLLNIMGGKVLEIWPLKPDDVKPVVSQSKFISSYRWNAPSGQEFNFKREQIIHWQYPDPGESRWGISPLQAASRAVDMDLAAAEWNRKVLVNDGKPPIAIMLSDKLSREQMREATDLVRDQIDGNNIRKALVISGATDAKPLSLSATELDFLNGRKFSKEEISACFGVPPILLTVGEGATFANLDAAQRILWETRTVPALSDYTEGWEMALFPFFGLVKGEYRIAADLKDVRALQMNLETETTVLKNRADAFSTLVGAGVPPNMAAAECGLGLKNIPEPKPPEPKEPDDDEEGEPEPGEKKSTPDTVADMLERREAWTDELKKRVAKLLVKQGNQIAASYVSGSPWEKDLRLNDWNEILKAAKQAIFESEGQILYSELIDAIKVGGGGSFDVLADNVIEWIEENAAEKVTQISDTSKAAIAKTIADAVEDGLDVPGIAKKIQSLHTNWAESRATTIARTEVNTSFNAAHHMSAEQFSEFYEIELEKEWLTVADKRRREEHKDMEGERVPLNEPFSNGLMFPSEPNCRCSVVFVEKVGK